jgi:hypothetical protein
MIIKNKNKIMTKLKQWLSDHKTHAFYIFIIGSALIIWLVGYPNTLEAVSYSLGQTRAITAPFKTVEAKEEVKEPTMEEWVMNEIKKAGLNEKEAWAIIQCESKWKEKAFNINNNKTGDFGLWEINQIHFNKDFTIQDALNYKTATKWAIEKRLRDGSWNAWVCNKFIN